MKLDEFMALTPEQRYEKFGPRDRCAACNKRMQGGEMTYWGLLCHDCWLDKLGDEVERHPIGCRGGR